MEKNELEAAKQDLKVLKGYARKISTQNKHLVKVVDYMLATSSTSFKPDYDNINDGICDTIIGILDEHLEASKHDLNSAVPLQTHLSLVEQVRFLEDENKCFRAQIEKLESVDFDQNQRSKCL
jgi:hypothetical protein